MRYNTILFYKTEDYEILNKKIAFLSLSQDKKVYSHADPIKILSEFSFSNIIFNNFHSFFIEIVANNYKNKNRKKIFVHNSYREILKHLLIIDPFMDLICLFDNINLIENELQSGNNIVFTPNINTNEDSYTQTECEKIKIANKNNIAIIERDSENSFFDQQHIDYLITHCELGNILVTTHVRNINSISTTNTIQTQMRHTLGFRILSEIESDFMLHLLTNRKACTAQYIKNILSKNPLVKNCTSLSQSSNILHVILYDSKLEILEFCFRHINIINITNTFRNSFNKNTQVILHNDSFVIRVGLEDQKDLIYEIEKTLLFLLKKDLV